MIEDNLRAINNWYEEPVADQFRPKFLSKLAILELCGWLEIEFDRLLLSIQNIHLQDEEWVNKTIIKSVNGFKYDDHFRAMLAKLVGETFARYAERRFETKHPGDLLRLKSILGGLWSDRCSFAHADIDANILNQANFRAPSWTLAQYLSLKDLLSRYENSVKECMGEITLNG